MTPGSPDMLPERRRVPFGLSMLGRAWNEEESVAVYGGRGGSC